jgi:hypothetical protein
MVILYTATFTIRKFKIMPTCHVPAIFMDLRLISDFALYYVDRFFFITQTDFLYCALRCEVLNIL